jgi:chaperone BCS1
MEQTPLSSIIGTAFPPQGNGSESAGGSISISPTPLLEAFIPGYGQIHKFLLYSLGFDVTIFVSLGAILWAGARICRSVWTVFTRLVAANWMAEISVTSSDEIYTQLLHFLAHQYNIGGSRNLMVETLRRSAWELDSDMTDNADSTVDAEGNIIWLNFSNQEAKLQPRFTPAIGSHSFWHNGTFFQLRRKEVTVFDEIGGSGSAMTLKDKEVLVLFCYV